MAANATTTSARQSLVQSRFPVPLLAVSMGDPAGIGPDIIIGAWLARKSLRVPAFVVIGDPRVLTDRAKSLGVDIALVEADAQTAYGHFDTALPVLPINCPRPVQAGHANPANAEMVIGAIRAGVELTLVGQTGAIVTAPIAKSVLYDAGFSFPGHTEFLASLAEEAMGKAFRPVMLLANKALKVAPVTIHIPLAEVPGALTTQAIIETARIMAYDLTKRFGIATPRLAISGLNPHAGENGALGGEDAAVIMPAIKQLTAEGILAFGPLPADTMFHEEARATYDAAICMYHDQALIPAKTLGFHDGVNVTLGLPFIRTSPDHGTAFSLAGTGNGRPDSMIAALVVAGEMATRQETANGLELA